MQSLASILSSRVCCLVHSRYLPSKAPVIVQCPACWVLLEIITHPVKSLPLKFQCVSLNWHIDAARMSFHNPISAHLPHSALLFGTAVIINSTFDLSGNLASYLPEKIQVIQILAMKPPNFLICHLFSLHFLLKGMGCFLFRFNFCVLALDDNILLRTPKHLFYCIPSNFHHYHCYHFLPISI